MQEVEIRLTAKEGFPIDYMIRLVFPHPKNIGQTITYEWFLQKPLTSIIYDRNVKLKWKILLGYSSVVVEEKEWVKVEEKVGKKW